MGPAVFLRLLPIVFMAALLAGCLSKALPPVTVLPAVPPDGCDGESEVTRPQPPVHKPTAAPITATHSEPRVPITAGYSPRQDSVNAHAGGERVFGDRPTTGRPGMLWIGGASCYGVTGSA